MTGSPPGHPSSRPPSSRRKSWRRTLRHHALPLLAGAIFVAMFALYLALQPRGIQVSVLVTAANKGVLLALIAAAQTLPVLTGGIDLSVGAIVVLANCMGSNLLSGSPLQVGLGVAGVLLTGLVAGAANGLAVVVGRLQPIIATLATSTMFYGLSLLLRPAPGGDVDDGFASAATGAIGGVPVTLLLLAAIYWGGWVPFRSTPTGRSLLAVGSSEASAFLSGVAVGRARFAAYTGAGLLAAAAGLLLTLVAESAQASAIQAGDFTLNSIAATVIGGTSLFGGVGGVAGSIAGAFILRTIGDLLFVTSASPLWQPLFQGLILLAAVSLAALPLLRVRNRLETFR